MKRFTYALTAVFCALMCMQCKTAATSADTTPAGLEERVAHTLIVKYEDEQAKEPITEVLQKYGTSVSREYHAMKMLVVFVPKKRQVEKVLTELQGVKGVKFVERDGIVTANDAFRAQ